MNGFKVRMPERTKSVVLRVTMTSRCSWQVAASNPSVTGSGWSGQIRPQRSAIAVVIVIAAVLLGQAVF